jgi:hypothetical protein
MLKLENDMADSVASSTEFHCLVERPGGEKRILKEQRAISFLIF